MAAHPHSGVTGITFLRRRDLLLCHSLFDPLFDLIP